MLEKRMFGMIAVIFIFFVCIGVSFADDIIIAKIGEKKITLPEAKKIITFYARGQDIDKLDARVIDQFMRSYVQSKVMAETAKEKGLDKDPTISFDMEILFNNILSQALLKKEVHEKIVISDKDMETYFKVHKDEFRLPEMVNSRHILIRVKDKATTEEKEAARKKAEQILKKIKDGEDFAKVASEVSEDYASREKGGEIGFVTKGQTVKSFDEKIFSMKPGEISDIVETKFGFHIIKVEERKAEQEQTFEQAKEAVKQKLYAQHVSARSKDLIEKAMEEKKVEIYSDKLAEAFKKTK